MDEDFQPYISADQNIPEFTFKSILVGVIITIVMGAANAYLGLFVGMTVSATIPSLVFALAILKPFKGSILEINMSKNVGVAGEALAAGIIFTFPALIVINDMTGGEAGWSNMFDFEHMIVIILIALVGGLFGILFTIPLRKVFIEDLDLPYPEGVAAAEVLKTMEKGGRGIWYILMAAGIGGAMKMASGSGLALYKDTIEKVVGTKRLRLFGGVNVSPALLGVGYIIGFKISLIVFSGGIIGWVILIPIIGLVKGWPTVDFQDNPVDKIGAVYQLWFDETKWVGIGAVLTGGIYTLIKQWPALKKSMKETIGGGKKSSGPAPAVIRTERDFKVNFVYLVVLALVVVVIYSFVTGEIQTAVILAAVMIVATFFFTAVAGYLAGIVGSSNNPISSVTISTLVVTAGLLLLLSITPVSDLGKNVGMTATILVAAVVCCSAAIAGDSMQELKTAQILGATPLKIQQGRFIGVFFGALAIPFVVALLASAYGIGSPQLPSPQAVIMGSTVKAIFDQQFNIIMVGIGVAIAIVLILLKLPVMAVAIGIYLPFTLTTPIFIGGLLGLISEKIVASKVRLFDALGLSVDEKKKKIADAKERTFNTGLLFAAGLVAGEAIFGVIVAGFIIGNVNLALFTSPSMIPGILALLFVMVLIVYMVIRDDISDLTYGQYWTVIKNIFKK
ncbi:MAG: OPT family oligopeptide transporter [Thermoplasmatota archaeon]